MDLKEPTTNGFNRQLFIAKDYKILLKTVKDGKVYLKTSKTTKTYETAR